MAPTSLNISCQCKAVSQEVKPRAPDSGVIELHINHSDIDRHATGLLCASYYPIQEPQFSKGTTEHTAADEWTRYFCSTCGCHVFRSKDLGGQVIWELATGVIIESTNDKADADARFIGHASVSDTKDGGISVWLSDIGQQPTKDLQQSDPATTRETNGGLPPLSTLVPENALPASCACGTVSFHITRPNDGSYVPHSGLADLLYAACTHSEDFMKNPDSIKWWIRADGTKYLAGTCACRSCRLISGFEIQTWAFVPRCNIFFHVPGPNGEQKTMPLDFTALPAGILKTHESSPGVLREFCGKCGATVFWHDIWRPDVIDVSVGLLRAEEGARAETWLDWWTERCSFEEEAERGRTGEPARIARKLIDGLERGLRSGAQAS
ncbi:hypothetical protein EsH8_II_001509 [Colletotrichum jinshuiense]